tara:strand:- start:336 stop:536 length:201 start_codon:yes stop_codon:yes gene_type:complete
MSKHKHHPFENQIFHHFRKEMEKVKTQRKPLLEGKEKIKEAIDLLTKYKYTVIDLEGKWITENTKR